MASLTLYVMQDANTNVYHSFKMNGTLRCAAKAQGIVFDGTDSDVTCKGCLATMQATKQAWRDHDALMDSQPDTYAPRDDDEEEDN